MLLLLLLRLVPALTRMIAATSVAFYWVIIIISGTLTFHSANCLLSIATMIRTCKLLDFVAGFSFEISL
jgi:hypothetical protein